MKEEAIMATFSIVDGLRSRMWLSDSHPEYGSAHLHDDGKKRLLVVNDQVWREWDRGDYPFFRRVKWSGKGDVVVWLAPNMEGVHVGALLVSRATDRFLDVGTASDICSSRTHIFATYSEDAGVRSSPGDRESNLLSVFSYDGNLLFGLRDLLSDESDLADVLEITSVCLFSDSVLIFLAYDSPNVWKLNAERREISAMDIVTREGGLVRGLVDIGNNLYALRSNEEFFVLDRRSPDDGRSLGFDSISFKYLFERSGVDWRYSTIQSVARQGFLLSTGAYEGMLIPNKY